MDGLTSMSSKMKDLEGGKLIGTRNWHPNDIKVDIPEYDGKLDLDEFVEWLRTVERVFDYKQVTDENKVKIVALKLRNYASIWWANTCAKREKAGKEKIRAWSKMKEGFSQLQFLQQGSGIAEEYSREFEYLLMKCDIPEDDPQTLVRYLGGLEPKIANVVELHTYQTLAELTLLAHKVDSQFHSKSKQDPNRSFKTTNYQKSPINQKTNPSKPYKPSTNSNPNPEPSKAPCRCFRCQGLGHIASECPNKCIISLADFELANGYDFETDSGSSNAISVEQEEEIIGPDEGECLVIRRALNVIPVQEENGQREAIFHTRCTIAQKVCTLIIDGGSCKNVASQTLVTKLNLPTENHPSPYMIHWLNQGKGIRVSQRVLLSFSIGKTYRDELWCDVIPMDTCHVLLGRPWQFDCRAIHDGYHNTYSFTHNKHKIVLTPTSPTKQSPHPSPVLATLLQSEHHEFHLFKEFILLGFDEHGEPHQVSQHPYLQTLLNSYSQVFPSEIPKGLPPARSIQHKIDLIPGSILPNKPAYRTNPHETNEIRKQVDVLLDKGLIRESLSPCAIPTLLVPKKIGE
uniref:uncharacterized protein LOC122583465 n=1 Tax=Erigeron canadensis TaxID=72917 RepID=UPI001CB94203|nr:uncharacterized protein LOC122583465 [Erigeron canadensis]